MALGLYQASPLLQVISGLETIESNQRHRNSDQRRRISVKDDPGSTSCINGPDGLDSRDSRDNRDGQGSPQSCHLYRPDPNCPDPTNVDSDPAPIQPTPHFCNLRIDHTQLGFVGSTLKRSFKSAVTGTWRHPGSWGGKLERLGD